MAEYDRKVRLYDVCVGGKSVDDTKDRTEYERTLEVSNAPDTFPCGHILCHKCIRLYLLPYRKTAWCCPVCNKEYQSINVPESSSDCSQGNDAQHVALMSNFDKIVKKFSAVKNGPLRRFKEENIKLRSVGMTYTSCPCSMCGDNHGTLGVVQEYNHLSVQHVRPSIADPYFYRLSTGRVVTSFYSTASSSYVCVPCTHKEILHHPEDFPAITNNNNVKGNLDNAMAEVSKVLTDSNKHMNKLHGKNIVDIDHKISIKERADVFDFYSTTETIKRLVKREEANLVEIRRCQIQDKGGLYHIKESNTIDYQSGETVV